MLALIITGIVSFISSDLDDIVVLTLLFTQAEKYQKYQIVLGQLFGIGSLVTFSLLIDYGLSFLINGLLKWMGLLPIFLGIKYWFDYYFRSKTDNSSLPRSIKYNQSAIIKILSICLLTISNGADNIGIYVPLFSQYNQTETVLIIIVYAIMTLVWCFIGYKLAILPVLKEKIEEYRKWVIPLIFIALGIYILIKNNVF
jgi:Predicted permease, cadmium resistance protein